MYLTDWPGWLVGGSTNSYKFKFLLRKFVPAFAEHFRVMCVELCVLFSRDLLVAMPINLH